MGNFDRGDRGDRFGGKRKFANDRGGRRDDGGGRSQMHSATCGECGKHCEVPFRPTGDKPVYCSDCFSNREGGGGGRFERRDSGRFDRGDKKSFRATCDKCHKPCEVPFKPTGDKPVYCSDCFGKGERSGGASSAGGTESYKKQFEMLNAKLDAIMKILAPNAPVVKIVRDEKPVVKESEKLISPKIKPKKAEVIKKVSAPKKVEKKAKKKAVSKKKKK